MSQMNDPQAIVTPLSTYRNETPYPFCPGCGHGAILDVLNKALVQLGRDPREVVLVTDIGCSGLSDQYFVTSAFHGLHGRSLTYASGIQLARPDLTVIVIMGDGGTGIGGAHLLNAARRNIGVTLLVFNNFNFGMTGGQHSTTTPSGAVTTTTRGGNLERPLDVCATVAANGASYVYRGTSFDKDLPDRIVEAIGTPGFSLLDIWELCTAYFVPSNKYSPKVLDRKLEELGFATGVIQKLDVPEYANAYRESCREQVGQPTSAPRPLAPQFEPALDRRFRLVVAGSAGGKVRSAVGMAAQAGIRSGLFAAQRDDYPITIMSGHSVSELILAPEPIDYTGIARPDALLILTEDGLAKAAKYLPRMVEDDRVFVLPAFADVETRARVTVIDPAKATKRVSKVSVALFAVTAMLDELAVFPTEALAEVARQGAPKFRDANLETIESAQEPGTR